MVDNPGCGKQIVGEFVHLRRKRSSEQWVKCCEGPEAYSLVCGRSGEMTSIYQSTYLCKACARKTGLVW